MADINKIKEKLQALLARARDAGSSEAEVEACMRRADKLMKEYGVTEADIKEATGNSFRTYDIFKKEGQKNFDPVMRYCAPAVGRLTGVKFWNHNNMKLCAFGFDADVEYAMWLLNSLRTFMDDQWAYYRDWQLGNCARAELHAQRVGFIRGYCATVAQRINAMTSENAAGGVKTGTDIIVLKNQVVTQEMERRGIHLGPCQPVIYHVQGAREGMAAGAVAGNHASVGRGVGQSYAAIGKA